MSVTPTPTLTLNDLECWNYPGTALAVLGHPIAHSLSPVMHNSALGEMTKTHPQLGNWRYFKFDIAPEDIPTALAQFHQKGFYGLNLTVPHKSLVIDHLIGTDEFVRHAGAANTLKRTEAGWHGSNTDGYGLSTALQDKLNQPLKNTDIILLGAGGAARGAALECILAGCASLWIGNRTLATAEKLLADLSSLAGSTTFHVFDPLNPPPLLPAGAIVINATSLGLAANDPAPLDLAKIARPAGVFDMIYRPAITSLLRQAASLRIPHTNGLSMLIHQGARSLQIWSGVNPPVSIMQQAVQNAL